jgi:hypothetical protein
LKELSGHFKNARHSDHSWWKLVSGTKIDVHHPKALVIRNGVAVYLNADGTPAFFDHESAAQLELTA